MIREMRMVSEDWKHPKNDKGKYEPLQSVENWLSSGRYYQEYPENYVGERQDIDFFNLKDYMPLTPLEERPLLMMYETCTDGTPISPAFKTPEELAHWLADNGASSFGSMTATYEQWLSTCKAGWAPSAVIKNGVLKSGVES